MSVTAENHSISRRPGSVNAENTDQAQIPVDLFSMDETNKLLSLKDGWSFSGAKGDSGLNTALIYLYQRKASIPVVTDLDDPLVYTFTTQQLSGSLGAWSATIPSGTDPLYVIATTTSANTYTSNITQASWSTPVILAQNGFDGTDGLNSMSITLYKRSATVPIKPSVSTTYTFATGVLFGQDNGWLQTTPDGTDPVYVTQATAISTTVTDTIDASEWSDPRLLVQNGTTSTFPSDDDCIFYAPCDDVILTSDTPSTEYTGIQSKILELNCTGLTSYTTTEEQAYNNVIMLKGTIASNFLLTLYFDGSNGNGSKQYQIVNKLVPTTDGTLTITTGISGKDEITLPITSLTLNSGCYATVDSAGNVTHFAGEKGDTGTAATIAVGTVTTLSAGSSATISNSGSTSAAVFNFEIPQGEKGLKGDQGSASIDGGYANSIYTSDQTIDGGSAYNG